MLGRPRPFNGAGAGRGTVKPGWKPPQGGKKTMAQTTSHPSTSQVGSNPAGPTFQRQNLFKGNRNNGNNKTLQNNNTQACVPRPENPMIRSKKSNITLRKINREDTIERKEVYKFLCQNDVLINHVYNTPSGFTVKTDSPRSVDLILSDRIAKKLESQLKLTPISPPEHQSHKTVVVKGIDEILGGNSAEAIKEEIIKNNADLKIESVIKFNGMTRIFKVICKDTATAEKICREGFKAFYYNVSTNQVEQEEHVKVNTCFKCYAHNKHNTNQCRSTIKICSECAQTGHIWRECQATVKKCINCTREGLEAGHRTLAMKCPLRKQVVKKIREQKAETKRNVGSTYAAVAANRANAEAPKAPKPSGPPPAPVNIVLNNDLSVKMTALILEAHISSIADSQKFSEYLSESIKLNYGVDVKFPERNSRGVFRMLSNMDQQSDDTHTSETASVAEEQMETEASSRKRAASPNESETVETRKKQRGQETQAAPSTSDGERSVNNSGTSPELLIESPRLGKSPTPRTSTPPPSPSTSPNNTASPSKKRFRFKVFATELPKCVKGSDITRNLFSEINPKFKLRLQSEDSKQEKQLIQMLKQNRLDIRPDDFLLVTKSKFNKLRNITYT